MHESAEPVLLTVRREGGSRVIPVTRLLPSDWSKVMASSRMNETTGQVEITFKKVG